MSYLFHSLQQFGFSSLEEVTASRLKRAFKRTVAMAHPDKGGDEGRFDAMLGSYIYLCVRERVRAKNKKCRKYFFLFK